MNHKQRGRKADMQVIDAGSIVLFAPLTERAKDWCAEHLPDDCPRMGVNYAIERRYAEDVFFGMVADGLEILKPTRH